MSSNEQLDRIEEKVQQVLKAYSLAQKEISRLQKENVRLAGQLHNETEKTSYLLQKVDALKINSGSLSKENREELEKRINTYLKDIEKCLALLQS